MYLGRESRTLVVCRRSEEAMAREVDDGEDARRIARELEERHQYQARARAMPRGPPRPARPRPRELPRSRTEKGEGGSGGGGAKEEEAGYGRMGRYDDGMEDGVAYDHAPVSQQSLVPSVSDPNLWMFSCPTGKEQELVYQIMNKAIAVAFAKIYVESYSSW